MRFISNYSEFVTENLAGQSGGLGFVLPFAFPEYEPTMNPGDDNVWKKFIGVIGRGIYGGNSDRSYGKLGHSGVALIDPTGRIVVYEFGRYPGWNKNGSGKGITLKHHVGLRASISLGEVTNADAVANAVKKVTHEPAPTLRMDWVLLPAINIKNGLSYAESRIKDPQVYDLVDFEIDDDDANCATFALDVVKQAGVEVSDQCWAKPSAMIDSLRSLNIEGAISGTSPGLTNPALASR